MATKKQKREAGIQKQAEQLARVTAQRLEAQRRDQEIRDEKERAAKEENQRLNARFENVLARAMTAPADELLRRITLSRLGNNE